MSDLRGTHVLLVSPSGTLPKLLLQRVAEAKAAKNRMHLDIVTPDIDAEAARLEGLGARRVEAQARTELYAAIRTTDGAILRFGRNRRFA